MLVSTILMDECEILTCVVEGSCLGSGTTLCPHIHSQVSLQVLSEELDPWRCDETLGTGPKGRGSLKNQIQFIASILSCHLCYMTLVLCSGRAPESTHTSKESYRARQRQDCEDHDST